jgi:hypothetical protein
MRPDPRKATRYLGDWDWEEQSGEPWKMGKLGQAGRRNLGKTRLFGLPPDHGDANAFIPHSHVSTDPIIRSKVVISKRFLRILRLHMIFSQHDT